MKVKTWDVNFVRRKKYLKVFFQYFKLLSNRNSMRVSRDPSLKFICPILLSIILFLLVYFSFFLAFLISFRSFLVSLDLYSIYECGFIPFSEIPIYGFSVQFYCTVF